MQTVQATLVAAAAAVALVVSSLAASAGEANSKLALTVSVDGAIGPATARYVKDALTKASERHAEVVVLRMNTPGGLSTSMREIIADVLASRVPVVGYVAPSGAHAASAGTYILYATHIAAMAPGTNLGAATPVQIGGPLPGLPDATPDKSDKDKKDGGDQKPKTKDAMTAKATNDAVALIRSLAEMRGRNADWAEKAVREAASLSANAALQANVIDLVARDPADLLRQIDGRTVEVAGGETRQLATRDAAREAIDPGWILRFLRVITDPNVAFILMLVGIYGVIFELSSPGAVAPGVIGTICLLLGLYALNMLPINYAGLGLILLGITLLVIEVFNSDRGSRPRRDRRIRPRSSDAVRDRSARIPAVMAGDRHHGGDLHRADPGCPRLASTCPKRPHTARRASHARPVRRNPRLVRERRPRLRPW